MGKGGIVTEAAVAVQTRMQGAWICLDRSDRAPVDWEAVDRALAQGSGQLLAAGRARTYRFEIQGCSAVLRHYRRGGLVAAWLGDRYLWRGPEASRPYRELAVNLAALAAGLPVPKPLGARLRRQGLWYRADYLSEWIPDSETVSSLLSVRGLSEALPWEEIGRQLAAMHRAGFEHADLNVHNLLLDAAGQVHIIDWDRGAHHPSPGAYAQRNLDRLARSLRKVLAGRGAEAEEAMRRLRSAYAAAP